MPTSGNKALIGNPTAVCFRPSVRGNHGQQEKLIDQWQTQIEVSRSQIRRSARWATQFWKLLIRKYAKGSLVLHQDSFSIRIPATANVGKPTKFEGA
ncbi:hypothetical protein ACLOJK_014631 [Asimina triloba]